MGKIAGIKRIPVTVLNLNRRSLFYEAYLGDWEVLALRVLAAPIYIILFGLCIWGIIGPAIFGKSRFRRRRVNSALAKNGMDLTNPAVNAIKERVSSSGIDEIEHIINSINSILTRNSQDDNKTLTISDETIEKLMRVRLLMKQGSRDIVINNDLFRLTAGGVTVRLPSVEDDMLERGILSKEDGKFKVNETACQALTVLAKAFGRKVPNIASSEVETMRADDTSAANGEKITVESHTAT